MTGCREEVLGAAREIVRRKGKNEFTVVEVIDFLRRQGSEYEDSTIRTHIVSRCCGNANKHHGTTYDDFRRVSRGVYRLTMY